MKKLILFLAVMTTCKFSFAQSYLPLTGGTLTGQVNGTTANFQTYTFTNSATSLNTTLTFPLIYGSMGGGTTFPFLDYSNLIIQSRPSGGDRDIAFVTGSTTPAVRMVVGRTGNIGIGVTSPVSLLNVSGSGSNANGIAYIQSSDAGARGTLIRTGFYGYTSQDNSGGYYQSWGMRLNGSDNLWYRTYTSANNYLPYTELTTGGTIVFGGAASNLTTDANPTLNPSMTINVGTGNVGIGSVNPQNKLDVNGTIHSKSVLVDLNGWSDYVFKKDYQLLPLSEVKTYIDQNQHLPGIPSEQEMIKNGLNVSEMNKVLTKKVEELTLYLIEQNKQLAEQKKVNQSLQEQIDKLSDAIKNQSSK